MKYLLLLLCLAWTTQSFAISRCSARNIVTYQGTARNALTEYYRAPRGAFDVIFESNNMNNQRCRNRAENRGYDCWYTAPEWEQYFSLRGNRYWSTRDVCYGGFTH